MKSLRWIQAEEALREAVVNALAHCDYRSNANVQIYVFKDRIEIVSPGGLPAGMAEADLGVKSIPRNPLLFGILHRMEAVENIESGIRRIYYLCQDYGLSKPKIDVSENWFTVTFPRPQVEGDKAWEKAKGQEGQERGQEGQTTLQKWEIAMLEMCASQDATGVQLLATTGYTRRTGSKQGIPDMLGVDKDSRVCIIEIKNEEAGEGILPQALGYAIWAETNPDSIKAIWLESKKKPEGIGLDWENLDIRIILIAPFFKPAVSRMAGKIGYLVDLVQVRRYCFEEEEFLIVEVLESKPLPKVGVTRVAGEWDWDFYESEHGEEATAQFRDAVEAITAMAAKQGWELPYNLTSTILVLSLGTGSFSLWAGAVLMPGT